MKTNYNIKDSAIDCSHPTICPKEFFDNSLALLNELQNNNFKESQLREVFTKKNKVNKNHYTKDKVELFTNKISKHNKNVRLQNFFEKNLDYNNIEQIDIIFEMLSKIFHSIKQKINQLLLNLIFNDYIEYNSISYIYFFNIIKLMKNNYIKKMDNLNVNFSLEKSEIEAQNEKKNKNLEKLLNKKIKMLDTSKKFNEELENKSKEDSSKFQQMVLEINRMKNENISIKTNNEKKINELTNINKNIKEENAKIKIDFEKINKENSLLKEDMAKIKNENSILKEENVKIKEDIAKINKENSLLKEDIEKIKNENHNLKEMLETAEKRNEEYKKEMDEKFDLLRQEYEGLKIGFLESDHLVNYYKDLNNQLIKKSLNNEEMLNSYLKKINILQEENCKLIIENNTFKNENYKMINEKENLYSFLKNKQLFEEFSKLKNNY